MSGRPKLEDVYPVGAKVETLRTDGSWHEAKVVKHKDSQLVLRFHDGTEGGGWDVEKSVKYDLVNKKLRPYGAKEPIDVQLPEVPVTPRVPQSPPPAPAPVVATPPPPVVQTPPSNSKPTANAKPTAPSSLLSTPDAGASPSSVSAIDIRPQKHEEKHEEKSHFFRKLFHHKKK